MMDVKAGFYMTKEIWDEDSRKFYFQYEANLPGTTMFWTFQHHVKDRLLEKQSSALQMNSA